MKLVVCAGKCLIRLVRACERAGDQPKLLRLFSVTLTGSAMLHRLFVLHEVCRPSRRHAATIVLLTGVALGTGGCGLIGHVVGTAARVATHAIDRVTEAEPEPVDVFAPYEVAPGGDFALLPRSPAQPAIPAAGDAALTDLASAAE